MKHLQECEILYKHQHGFRKNHSSEMSVLQLVNKIHSALNNNKYALGIFLDLSKASDIVNHDTLLKNCYTTACITCNWFYNYIHNRQHFVNMNG